MNPTSHPIRALLVASAVALTVATLAPPAGAAAPDGFCPTLDKKGRVYLIGSSTMGSVLGPMLQKSLKKRWDIDARRWGKASSGLARPDYHDWPKEVPRLMKRHKPDFVVVSLGTNDNQPLRRGKGWIKIENKRWSEIYRERVDQMLERIAGEDRARRIIWLGPVALNGPNARVLGPRIDKILREQIAAFDGHAEYIDIRKVTKSRGGGAGETFKRPGRKAEPSRTPDGVHLTTAAVRYLLERPVLEILSTCLDPKPVAAPVAKPEKTVDDEPPTKTEAKAEPAPADAAGGESKKDTPAPSDDDGPASERSGKGS